MIIQVDQAAFQKDLTLLQLDQFPFAMAKTLTDLARVGQDAVRQRTRQQYKLHTDFIPGRIRMTPARKADVNSYRAQSVVFADDKIAFMTIHETGQNKVPLRTALAIPTILANRIPNFKTGTGKIKKQYQPAALLKKWNAKDKAIKGKASGQPSAYIIDGTVFARAKQAGETGKRSIPVFGFKGTAKIKPDWRFGLTVKHVVDTMAFDTFKFNFQMAMLTARI